MQIEIGICTFARPHLAATLRSVGALRLQAGWDIRIIVADNDETPSARSLVQEVSHATGLSVTYIHAPARNISIARNACLDASTAPWFAFIDDDELVTPDWLIQLFEAQAATQADVVFGPVHAIYSDDAPRWMQEGDFHSTRPVWVEGEIQTGYTCNTLMRRAVIEGSARRFRIELGQSGGEDTIFFHERHAEGFRFAYAPGAIVTEEVPPARAQLSWLLARRYRSGQTHGRMLVQKGHAHRWLWPVATLVAASKIGFCCAVGLTLLFHPLSSRKWLLRGFLHAGVVSSLMGRRTLIQYGGSR